ncbi:hypothetical protein ACLDXX_17645, partial [Acinetobacter baumannii]
VICGPIGCAVDFVCRLLHLKIISLKNPLQIGLCNKAVFVVNKDAITQLNWKIDNSQKTTSLNISNIGNRHALLNDLKLVDLTENKSYSIKVNTVNGYILAEQSRSYPISNFSYQPDHKYSISLTVNGKKVTL